MNSAMPSAHHCERCSRTDMPATVLVPVMQAGTYPPIFNQLEAHFCAPCLNGLRHGWHGHRVPNFPPFGEGIAPRHIMLAAAANPCQS